MGDVKLTPRKTAALLDKLDGAIDQVAGARRQLIEAMAERQHSNLELSSAPKSKRKTAPRRRKVS